VANLRGVGRAPKVSRYEQKRASVLESNASPARLVQPGGLKNRNGLIMRISV
jgi:hypothetical protein